MVSIIVPVYNAEQYINRCLTSIKDQTYQDFEVIIVDDGSEDKSAEICDQFGSADKRYKVYRQSNKGPSSARNSALSKIKGEYLLCVDADDTLHSDALERAVSCLRYSCSDVCVFGWTIVDGNDVRKLHCFDEDEMIEEPTLIINELFRGNYRCGGGNPWNKLWRVSALKKHTNTIPAFDESITIYEDFLWTIQCLEKCDKVCFLNEQLYDYYILPTSLSRIGNQIERRRKYYLGAKRLYDYILENESDAVDSAYVFYQDIFTFYLKSKVRWHGKITNEEIQEFRKIPSSPTCFASKKKWLWHMAINIYILFQRVA